MLYSRQQIFSFWLVAVLDLLVSEVRLQIIREARSAAAPALQEQVCNESRLSLRNPEFHGELANLRYCKAMCTTFISVVDETSIGFSPLTDVRCYPCHCHQGCERYGTCCVRSSDKYTSIRDVSISELDILQKQQSRHAIPSHLLRCVPLKSDSRTHFLMVGSCGVNVLEDLDQDKCERTVAEDELSIADYLYVFDPRTNVTYKNKFCSKCNGIGKTEPWRLSIHCAHYQMVYTATSEDELLRLSLAMSSSCEVNRWPPDLENLTLCRRDWFENLIYQCNVTGKWEKHDPDVEERCARKSQISNRIRAVINNEEVLFSNLYCMYCNLRKDEVYDLSLCDMDIRAPHNYFNYLDRPPPFSLLLGLKDSEPEKIYEYVSPTLGPDNCNDTEWATPDGDCLPLNCTPGKIASDFNCTTALDRIRGLGYTISLYLTAQMISDTAHNTTSYSFETRKSNHMVFRRAVKKIFKDLPLDDYSISLSPIFDVDNVSAPTDAAITEKKGCSGQECYISACMIASELYGRDYIEELMVNGLVGNFTMTGSKTHLLNVTYHMIPLVNAHKTECKSNFSDKLILNPPKKEDLDSETLIRQFYRETYSKFPDSFQIWNYIDAFIALSNTLNCLFVSFPSDKFKLQREKDSSVKSWSFNIEFDSAEIIVSDPIDLSGALVGEDGQLKVCRYVLQKNMRLRKRLITSYAFSTNSDMSFWQSTVTLICLGASTACLAITVVTYCLFAELRSIAGWHNLLLAATLLVAQGLLLASAYTDGPSTWCTVLGVATHYSWLSMFCWSFACCFHMFRVFTAKTRMAGRDSASARRLFLMKRVVFTAGIPAVVVTSLMVGVNTSTGGQDIGYGKRSCYLDSAFLVGVATVLPLAVVTLCNVVFFTVAVYKIYSVRKLQSNDMAKKENTKNLFVYIRLSTLTGVCWTIAIIAEAADNDPLRFIYIIFNGLQGVFIFLSYICNRRVLLLYTGKDSEKKNTSSALSESGTNRQHRSEVTTSTFSSTISGPD